MDEFKVALLNTGLFKQIPSSSSQYRCKECPFCGDTKNHLYVKIKLDDDSPVVYNCFKCNASGIINQKFLEYFGLEDTVHLPKWDGIHRRKLNTNDTARTVANPILIDDTTDIHDVCQYINKRVGVLPTIQDLQAFQYVPKPFDYAREYLGNHNGERFFNGKVWFRLTNGNIIGRSIDDDAKYRWLRYRTNKVIGNGLYTIQTPIDVYQDINVCISEGIMDSIGLYYHHHDTNGVYISTMGSDYLKGIQHILNMGIFGTTVTIKIFKDSDVDSDRIYIPNTMKRLFKRVEIYQNMIGKDYGVPSNELDIQRVMICRKSNSFRRYNK